MSIEVMKQALKALEDADQILADEGYGHALQNEAITALKAALEQPEQGQWDAIPDAFNEWWDADYDDTGNPYRKDSPAYWAWAGWSAANKEKNR
jgi:hypothetical protein